MSLVGMGRTCVWVTAFVALTGCAATDVAHSPVASVVANPTAHMASAAFAPESLPDHLRAKLAQVTLPPGRTLVYRFERVEVGGGFERVLTGRARVEPRSDGLFHVMTELSANGIPFLSRFESCFSGTACLMTQTVPHTARIVRAVTRAVSVDEITAGGRDGPEGSEYVTAFTLRHFHDEALASNPWTERSVCRNGKRSPASTIHPKLAGDAIEQNCEVFVEGVLQLRARNVLLTQYGVAIQLGTTSPRRVTTMRVTDVETP